MGRTIEKNLKNINIGYVISMGVLCLIVGLVIAIQTKTQAETEAIKQAPSRQLEQTVALLKEAEEKKANLEKQLSELRKQIEGMQKAPDQAVSKENMDKVYMLAGLTEVEGKGIKVTLDDRNSSKNATPDNDGLVHAEDVLKLANDLKSGGATAISVNNQRLVTTSEIVDVDAGSSMLINQTRLVSPYVITALGDPDALKVSLTFRGGIVEFLRFYGIDVKIDTIDKGLKIPPYTGKI